MLPSTAVSRLACIGCAVTVLALAQSADVAHADPARHLPAIGTDVAAPDQQASLPATPSIARHVPASGTDVAAIDQQAPAAPAPPAASAGDSGELVTLPAILSLIAAASLLTAGAITRNLVHSRRRDAV